MRSRSSELLDRSIAAMAAAIEIYNKPSFPYRSESFTILAINGWELLLKARWLTLHQNQKASLYVYETRRLSDGTKGRKLYIKKTRSGDPFTHSIEYLANQLVEKNDLDTVVQKNIVLLMELRDSATHFYEQSRVFQARLYEISAACVKNYVNIVEDWFGKYLSELGVHIMPLSFIEVPERSDVITPRDSERNFLALFDDLSSGKSSPESRYSVSVNVDVKFTRSKATSAVLARLTNDPSATKIQLKEEDVRETYPWDYAELSSRCKERYVDFKENRRYHDLRKDLQKDPKYANARYLDPGNPKSAKKIFFNPNMLNELDKHYARVRARNR